MAAGGSVGAMIQQSLFGSGPSCPLCGLRMEPDPVCGLVILPADPGSCGLTWDASTCNHSGGWDDCPRRIAVAEIAA
jgi:hypothetical protein